jgi:hypothetical protein
MLDEQPGHPSDMGEGEDQAGAVPGAEIGHVDQSGHRPGKRRVGVPGALG